LLVSSLASVFPHGHIATQDPELAVAHGLHPARADACLESVAHDRGDANCALCCFQRIVSQGQIQSAPHLLPDRTPAIRPCAWHGPRASAPERHASSRAPPGV
jgi:hypothetical protein